MPFSSSLPRAQDFVCAFKIMAEEFDLVSEDERIHDGIAIVDHEFDVASDDIEAPVLHKQRPRRIKTNSTQKTCALLVVHNDRSVECDVIDNLWATWHPLSFTVIRIRSGYLMF